MTIPSPSLFQRIVEEMPEAVIVSDRVGMIVYWNRAADAMFGHSAVEATGRSLDLIIPERFRARHWAGYRTVMFDGRDSLRTRVARRPRDPEGWKSYLARVFYRAHSR